MTHGGSREGQLGSEEALGVAHFAGRGAVESPPLGRPRSGLLILGIIGLRPLLKGRFLRHGSASVMAGGWADDRVKGGMRWHKATFARRRLYSGDRQRRVYREGEVTTSGCLYLTLLSLQDPLVDQFR